MRCSCAKRTKSGERKSIEGARASPQARGRGERHRTGSSPRSVSERQASGHEATRAPSPDPSCPALRRVPQQYQGSEAVHARPRLSSPCRPRRRPGRWRPAHQTPTPWCSLRTLEPSQTPTHAYRSRSLHALCCSQQ
eukprot:Amastigsp_a343098_18.p3 type:complete len:137 gc:universal Amastigsp_a343098_18:501-91(-)